MKEKNTPQYEMVDIYKSTIEKESEAVEKEYFDDTEEIDLSDFEMEMDFDDTPVLPIDGVLIQDDEEVSLLFYHHKPEGINFKEEVIRCKAVAEMRISRSKFNNITRNFDAKLNSMKQRKIDDFMFNAKLSMFV